MTGNANSAESDRRIPINLQKSFTWDQLASTVQSSRNRERVAWLKTKLDLDQAQFLLSNLASLQPPENIHQLAVLERTQEERGAGFLGIIPTYFQEEETLPTPATLTGLLEAAVRLTRIRKKNRSFASQPEFNYELTFSHQPIPELTAKPSHPGIKISLDTSAVDGLLALFNQEQVTLEQALEISSHHVFVEMLAHRRELGYIPEPLPDSEDLAFLICTAASQQPEVQLWKWLNPFNLFNLADLYLQQEEYRQLLEKLKTEGHRLLDRAAAELARYVPDDFQFQGEVALGVNWGIRSWTTSTSLGTNITQYKDDYQAFLKTITHELFHRMQLILCTGTEDLQAGEPPDFEDITTYPFPDEKDRTFYRTLSYLALEGSATLVGGPEEDWDLDQMATAGIELLTDAHQVIYRKGELEKVEELLNKGLKNNGPYYALGYLLSRQAVNHLGKKSLGDLLQNGPAGFLARCLKAGNSNLKLPASIRKDITRLAEAAGQNA